MKITLPSKYGQRRADGYPALAEQLDMLWHGMNDDSSKRIEPFYSTIKAVKKAHPKNNQQP